ncbi:MAG TPA: hypothetical protein VM783_07840 [Candidatus Acidoferrum sp.]|nr:hypothetical protein [Candidatus Acidoferrum sp.]
MTGKTQAKPDWIKKWSQVYGAMSVVQLTHQLDKLARAKRWDGYTKTQKHREKLIRAAMNNQVKVMELINPVGDAEAGMMKQFIDATTYGTGVAIRSYDPILQRFTIRPVEPDSMWKGTTTGRFTQTYPQIQELPKP